MPARPPRLLLLERLAPFGRGLLGGLDVGRLLVVPRLPLVERQRDHARVHVRVVAPAQLGALALHVTRLVTLNQVLFV